MYYTFKVPPRIKHTNITVEEILNDLSFIEKGFHTITTEEKVKTRKHTLKTSPNATFEKHVSDYYDQDTIITNCNRIRALSSKITKERYHHFTIPKKSDPTKKRPIDAPCNMLKGLQTEMKLFLEDTLHMLPSNEAYAYAKGRCHVDSVKVHQENESKWFLKIDLKDFFPSHTPEYIERMLKQIYPIQLFEDSTKDAIIECISEVGFLDGKLPMGTPLSPTLTNLCMVPIDYEIKKKLIEKLPSYSLIYTRYADDMIISCKYNFDFIKVIQAINEVFRDFNAPFTIKKDKTQFGSSSGRNWTLGVMLNKDNKITIGHKNNQKLRSMIFNFFMDHFQVDCIVPGGNPWSKEEVQKLQGLLAYYHEVEPEYLEYCKKKYSKKFHKDFDQLVKERLQ